MSFEQKYKNIKNTVKEDFDFLEQEINDLFVDSNPLNETLSGFLKAPAKRLRPLLGFLFLRCAFGEITPRQHKVLLAAEIIHNASLIHDDVIDNSDKRRDQKTINAKFDENLAVVAGDFLLSLAMEKIVDTESIEVLKMFTSALKATCYGEIKQYFNKFKLTSIEEYIGKSKEKTALLFQIGILSSLLLSEKEVSDELMQSAINFSENFGIAFQIRDDLLNLLNTEPSNADISNDISLGIYTAPVIFAYQENKNVLKEENILDAIRHTRGIEKTKNLMDNCFDKAISAVEKFDDNKYKQAILELVALLKD